MAEAAETHLKLDAYTSMHARDREGRLQVDQRQSLSGDEAVELFEQIDANGNREIWGPGVSGAKSASTVVTAHLVSASKEQEYKRFKSPSVLDVCHTLTPRSTSDHAYTARSSNLSRTSSNDVLDDAGNRLDLWRKRYGGSQRMTKSVETLHESDLA